MARMTPEEFWQEALKFLHSSLADAACKQWLEPLKPVSLTDTELTLVADTSFARDFVKTRYSLFIEDAAQSILSQAIIIRLITISEWNEENPLAKEDKKEASPDTSDNFSEDSAVSPASTDMAIDEKTGQGNLFTLEKKENDSPPPEKNASSLTPLTVISPGDKSSLIGHYTFDNFVTGSSNRFAHAAAKAVAESPGMAYNPFFIYGGVGLGKTHLMHAIGNQILENYPNMRVLYITSEKFTNEFINSIMEGRPEKFRQKYRGIDALLVDDIQFLHKKESTQEEFFHTFNTLYNEKKQIILSSDRRPNELKTLEDRLRSRFEWGLITDIQAPDLETRIAILQKKAMVEHISVPNDVLVFIASRIDKNIRELEGALTRVVAYSSLYKSLITTDSAEKAMANIYGNRDKPNITIELIQELVSNYYKVSKEDILGKERRREIVVPRQVAIYLCRELTDTSMPQIGRYFGDRDHTTVMHACEKIRNERSKNSKIDNAINELVAQLNRL